jgi:hypothetical protein
MNPALAGAAVSSYVWLDETIEVGDEAPAIER